MHPGGPERSGRRGGIAEIALEHRARLPRPDNDLAANPGRYGAALFIAFVIFQPGHRLTDRPRNAAEVACRKAGRLGKPEAFDQRKAEPRLEWLPVFDGKTGPQRQMELVPATFDGLWMSQKYV